MNEIVVAEAVIEYLLSLPDDTARLAFLTKIDTKVCHYCGSTIMPCYCTKDD